MGHGFLSNQQCHQFMLYLRTDEVHEISIFKEYTIVCAQIF